MNDLEIRLECIRMATDVSQNTASATACGMNEVNIVDLAQRFYDFVQGRQLVAILDKKRKRK